MRITFAQKESKDSLYHHPFSHTLAYAWIIKTTTLPECYKHCYRHLEYLIQMFIFIIFKQILSNIYTVISFLSVFISFLTISFSCLFLMSFCFFEKAIQINKKQKLLSEVCGWIDFKKEHQSKCSCRICKYSSLVLL